MSQIDLLTFDDTVVTDDQKRSYKKRMRKLRRKLRFVRKSKNRAMTFMAMAINFDHESQVEINQKYYSEKIEKLSQKEETIITAKNNLKSENKRIRDSIKAEKKVN